MTRPWHPSPQAVTIAIRTYSRRLVLENKQSIRYWMRRALRAAYRIDHPTRVRKGR